MNCLQADILLQRHFDGELPPALDFAVTRHLQRCLSCRLEFDKVRREMRDLIVDIAEPRFDPESLRARVAQAIAPLRPRHPIPLAPVSVTLSFALAVGLGWNLFRSAAPAPMEPLPAFAPSSSQTILNFPGARIALEAGGEICEGIPVMLRAGAAIVEVQSSAEPFRLETPAGTVSCQEGKFRVGVSSKDSSSSLLILEGEVRWEEGSGVRHLQAGEAVFRKNDR